MNGKTSLLFFSILLFWGATLMAENILIVDSLSRIESCRQFSAALKLSPQTNVEERGVGRTDYNTLSNRFSDAQKRFYGLDMPEAERGFEEVVKTISDAFVSGGRAEEIYDIFGRSLLYLTLIKIIQKREEEAREIFKEYFTILSTFHVDNKRFHPSLISFITENSPVIQKSIKYDSEISLSLRKAFRSNGEVLFDSSQKIPQSVATTRHLLILSLENNTFRTMVRNFSEDKDLYFLIWDSDKERVYLSLDEGAFKRITQTKAGRELVYCLEGENGLILSDGRRLKREEALGRSMKVEIVRSGESVDDRWYNRWWVYAGGGMLAAAIVTSIILLNTDGSSKESFRDHIQIK